MTEYELIKNIEIADDLCVKGEIIWSGYIQPTKKDNILRKILELIKNGRIHTECSPLKILEKLEKIWAFWMMKFKNTE